MQGNQGQTHILDSFKRWQLSRRSLKCITTLFIGTPPSQNFLKKTDFSAGSRGGMSRGVVHFENEEAAPYCLFQRCKDFAAANACFTNSTQIGRRAHSLRPLLSKSMR